MHLGSVMTYSRFVLRKTHSKAFRALKILKNNCNKSNLFEAKYLL